MSSILVVALSRWAMGIKHEITTIMAVGIVHAFEVIDVNEIEGDVPSDRRQGSQRSLKPFHQTRTVRKPSQHVMMGEEMDASISLLLLASASIPSYSRDREAKTGQSA
jgi:hypothetical protein